METMWEREGFPQAAKDGSMRPNPMYMLLGNMTQSDHGPVNYQGNLIGSPEKIVSSVEEARAWVDSTVGTRDERDYYTLIKIQVLDIITPTR